MVVTAPQVVASACLSSSEQTSHLQKKKKQKNPCSPQSLQIAQLGEIWEYLFQIQNGGCRKKASLPEETVTWAPAPQTSKALHKNTTHTAAQTKT